ncbi:MAG: glycosyltransferase [Candidatus Aminicenantes bacterium]|nr:glycosyltransferase [Candidatus Aminicenantes bacterium]
MSALKFSIITAVYNGARHIASCLESVRRQTHDNVEHIIVDGKSTDDTLAIIGRHGSRAAKIVSEADRGLYDAMNKGIAFAEGDIVGILNSDDFYDNDRVLERVAAAFDEYGTMSVYTDLLFVSRNNPERIIRYCKAKRFTAGMLAEGEFPMHSAFFVRKEAYRKYGVYRTDMKISADIDLMLRFLEKHRLTSRYLPFVSVRMRSGGISNRNAANIYRVLKESYSSFRLNGLEVKRRFIVKSLLWRMRQFRDAKYGRRICGGGI